MEVIMGICTLIIRVGAAAFLMAMAGKILHVTVAHSKEPPTRNQRGVGHKIPVAGVVTPIGDRGQLKPKIAAPNRGLAEIAKSIRAQDVDCPTVMNVGGLGHDAYGQVFRVQCGPARGRSAGFSYLRVTIQPNGEAVISPEN
jgi:hypothetical protein